MTLYYDIKRNKYRGDMVIVYDDSKPFKDSIRILNNSKQHDADKDGLKDVLRGDTFIGPEAVCYKKEKYPLLFFKFAIARELSGVGPMMSDKSLIELKDLADKFDKDYTTSQKGFLD